MLSISQTSPKTTSLKVEVDIPTLTEVFQELADKISRAIVKERHYEVDNKVLQYADMWRLKFEMTHLPSKIKRETDILIKYNPDGTIPVARQGQAMLPDTTDDMQLPLEFFQEQIREFFPSIIRRHADTLFHVNTG